VYKIKEGQYQIRPHTLGGFKKEYKK